MNNSSDPLHVAFVWHMHQPYYRSRKNASFNMPWARMHALKDYLDMVQTLSDYPALHQTFNLVPSLVEQLETYASGQFTDIYWDLTLKPAADLEPSERAFIVERMCERSDHPRARSHPRYLELALKREAQASQGWEACASTFTVDELRDLQVWFNLAWFDPATLEQAPLSALVSRGQHFTEEDKAALAMVQEEILRKTLPAYREAAARGQIELSTSPYYHPILPLLIDTDSARIAAADILLPRRRFAHPEDAWEQIRQAIEKHERTFGQKPEGVWCSEQAVGDAVIPLLAKGGFTWTISDETVLYRSLSGVASPLTAGQDPLRWKGNTGSSIPSPQARFALYMPYRLDREDGSLSIVFRDHNLSDLIGFAYHSWDSRDAATDLLRRLREIRTALVAESSGAMPTTGTDGGALVTIALDGENAWEYYPRDGRDFLHYLYEGLSTSPEFRCVTISEHLRESPATIALDWLHTGSWVGGDLRTWIGDPAHALAWELLHDARDTVSHASASLAQVAGSPPPPAELPPELEEAWQHIYIAEGSDWFWWFSEHHRTELDFLWDMNFRHHLEEAYLLVGEAVHVELLFPILVPEPTPAGMPPTKTLSPVIDGLVGTSADGSMEEWTGSGVLAPALPSTMQCAEVTGIKEVRYGRDDDHLCLLVVPEHPSGLENLEVRVQLVPPSEKESVDFLIVLEPGGTVRTECKLCPQAALSVQGAWKEVLELSLPLAPIVPLSSPDDITPEEAGPAGEAANELLLAIIVRIGRRGMVEHVFHSAPVRFLARSES